MMVTDVQRKINEGTKRERNVTGFYMQGYMKENLDGIPTYLKHAWDCIGIISGHGKVRIGKTQPAGSKVLMADGSWKNVEEINIGDEVISPDVITNKSKPSKVIEVHDYLCNETYSVLNKNNGEYLYSCSDNHEIPVEYLKQRKKKGIISYERIKETIEAKDIYKMNLQRLKNIGLVSYQGCFVDKFNTKNSTIDPYSLGVFLGDGNISKNKNGNQLRISCSSEEIMDRVSQVYPSMSKVKKKGCDKCFGYRFSSRGEFYKELIRLGLENKTAGDKFIPEECKISDSSYRLNLLSGLIDTDGYVSRKGVVSYITKSKRLAEDIQQICRSLGGNSRIKKITKQIKSSGFVGDYYSIQINIGELQDKIILSKPFKKERLRRLNQAKNKISILLRKEEAKHVYGFEIDSSSHLYVTDNFCVTHNSTIASQVAFYLAWILAGGKTVTDDKGKVVSVIPPKNPVRFSLKENVVFSSDALQERAKSLYEKYGKNQVILYDEGRQGLDSKRAMESINKGMSDFFQECGFMGHVILIVLPNFFQLHEDYAVARSLFLIDAFAKGGIERGYFNFYNEKQKELLYYFGKKRIGVSAKYMAANESFWGRFSAWLPFDKEEYEHIKAKELEKKRISRLDKKTRIQRNFLVWCLHREFQQPFKAIAELFKSKLGMDMNINWLHELVKETDDILEG